MIVKLEVRETERKGIEKEVEQLREREKQIKKECKEKIIEKEE
jgi:hypothetical protein